MSAYEPPTQNLAIFDPDVFTQNDEPLTIATGSKYFLKYPSAQGTENLQAVNVNGVLTANSSTNLNGQLFVAGTSSFEDVINLSSITPGERRIYSSYYNLKDTNGNVSRTSEIYQNSQILTLTNESISGRTRFINSTAGNVPTTTFEIDTNVATMYEPLSLTSNLDVAGTLNANGAFNVPNNDAFIRGIRIGFGGGNLDRNMFIGITSGLNNTTGNDNTSIGTNSGRRNTTGISNVFIGSFTGQNNTTGSNNTFIGRDAGTTITTQQRNTFIGREAGYYNTGNDNVCIGDQTDCSGNISNSMAIGSTVKATASNTIVLGTSSQTTQIAGPVVLGSNSNLTMSSGTGIISQPTVANDITTNNQLRRTTIQYNNSGNATANPAMEIYESAGRGFYFVPNVLGGAYGPNTQTGDSAIISRHFAMATTSLLFATGTSLRNHLKLLANTDLTSCSLVLQNGANAIDNASEFRMDYNSTGPVNIMSFNNPINFNPTNNGAINSNRRLLSGLGTLSFTDISGNNTTTGSTTSRIWTDSSLVSGLGRGMFLDCSINGGDIIFRTNDTNGVKSTSLALNGDLNTSYNRVYQELNPSWNRVNGFYELAKDAYPALNPKSSGVSSVSTWTTRTTSIDLSYYSVAWSPELSLFCAVAETGSGGTGIDRVITSPDGITWTQRNCFAQGWRNVIWASDLGLFVASCITGTTTQRIMTSPDGINWTLRTTPNDNNWRGIAWSPELQLLVCVADSGTDRVMTSITGITWAAVSVSTGNWQGVCWSAELGIFVAVGSALTGTRVMTSPDGTNWTLRNSAADNTWRNVIWASELGLFVAVGSSGFNNRVMTSPNGINWTTRTTNSSGWRDITWSPELKLFCAVADSGIADRVMTSPDGINWTTRTTNNNIWLGVCWSPELGIFCSCAATGTNDRIMTSSLQGRPPTSYNVFDSSSNIIDENGDWTLKANTIYATQLDIRRNYSTPLSRLEIVNDGANSSYIKSRAPSGQSVLFLNTYNGVSDDETMNVSSTRIQVRRPIQFNYLTTPNASTQLGFQTGPTAISSGAFSTATTERNFSSFTIVNAGMYNVSVTLILAGNANHTLTEWRYCLDGTSATFPSTSTPTKFTMSIRGNPPVNLDTSTTSYFNTTFNVLATANEIYYINFKMVFAGGGTTNIGAVYSYTRIG